MVGSGKELILSGGQRSSTDEVEDEVLDRMIRGETIVRICTVDRRGFHRQGRSFPRKDEIYDWADPGLPVYRPEFAVRFARACLEQQRTWLEECIDISNEPASGYEEVHEYSEAHGVSRKVAIRDMLGHRALRIKTRLEVIARMNPQMWAERLQQLQSNENDSNKQPDKIIIIGGLPEEKDEPSPPFPTPPTPEE